MVPSTWLTVLFYALLVAPGLLHDLLEARRRVQAPESAFREISRVVLVSLVISIISFGILSIIRSLEPAWMPDPRGMIADPHAYFLSHYRLVLRALLIEGAIALAIVWIIQIPRHRRTKIVLRQTSTWTRAFREECPSGNVPYVQVRVSNGMTYVGRVGHFTHDLEVSDRELILTPPLFTKSLSGTLKPVPPPWQRVVLSGDFIRSLVVSYGPEPEAPLAEVPGRLRRGFTWLALHSVNTWRALHRILILRALYRVRSWISVLWNWRPWNRA